MKFYFKLLKSNIKILRLQNKFFFPKRKYKNKWITQESKLF